MDAMLSATDALRVTQPPNNSFAAIGNEKEVSLLVVTTAYPHCPVEQWGIKESGKTEALYPIAFTSLVFTVLATNTDKQGAYADNAFGYSMDLTKCYVACKGSSTGEINTNFGVTYLAIGH
ncbi:gp53-like domain-containing protein [Megasphaera stantonii]|uniref:gp53-like domain-containing protein n=1 Tax=Megasphaera stantonii TaxID=2144175 RepID=UPI003207BFE4